jgi:uncharacterized protein
MKESKYNLIFRTDDSKYIAFNSTTCALAEVEEDFFEILRNIEEIDYEQLDEKKKRLVDAMQEGNYIIKNEVDEIKLLKYRHLKSKYESSSLGLVIAVTLGCNFDCSYCYENLKKGFISQEAIDGIVEMVNEAAKKKNDIHITWYGGEPLLGKDIIYDLSDKLIQICNENGAHYNAYIVTNGYLLTDEIIHKLKAVKVTGAQVTIDGPPKIHNSRRRLKGSGKETFDTILNNVIKLKENKFDLTIRVNIDKTNTDYLNELFDILETKNLKDLSISFGHVTAYTEACMSIAESCFDIQEYANQDFKYQQLLYKRKFNIEGYPNYPGVKGNYCCADSQGSFVIDPEGYMYKCWNDVGNVERAVGDIKIIKKAQDEKMLMRNIKYLFWSPFEHEKCVKCNLLPICMGGCPFNGEKNGQPDCEKWKYSLEKTLCLTYEKNKNKMCEEEIRATNT